MDVGTPDLHFAEAYALIEALKVDRTSLLYRTINPDDWFWDDPYYQMQVNTFNAVRIIAGRTPSPSKTHKDAEPITRTTGKPKERAVESAYLSNEDIASSDWGFSLDDIPDTRPTGEPDILTSEGGLNGR